MADLGSDSNEWVVGVMIRLVGAAAINLGMILQKSSLNRNDAREEAERRSCLRQSRWVLGTTTLALGHILTFLSLSYAAASLIAVLGAFSLVTNPLFAWLILGERPLAAHALSILLIGAGCGLVVVYADHGAQEYTPGDLAALWENAGTIVLVAACVVLMAAFAVGWRRRMLSATQYHDSSSADLNLEAALPAAAGHSDSDSGAPKPTAWMVVALIVGSAVCGAWSFVFAKILAQLLKFWGPAMLGSSAEASDGVDAAGADELDPNSLGAYAFALGMVVCVAAAGITQVYVIQQAFRQKRGRALLVIADYFAVHTLLTTLFATTYFNEWSMFADRPFEGGMFLCGVALAIAGVRVDHVIEARLAKGAEADESAGEGAHDAGAASPPAKAAETATSSDSSAPASRRSDASSRDGDAGGSDDGSDDSGGAAGDVELVPRGARHLRAALPAPGRPALDAVEVVVT